ncbi:MAG: hypothetical protein SGJ23_09625 [Alphaproteobacteria bacterium]|nr:hypothetical protein [Alphaproteobacteria bacterium]
MGFDDEVDSARRKLEAALSHKDEPFDDLAALQALLPLLVSKIQSRRLTFQLGDDDDETSIEIVHTQRDEALGFIFADDGEYVFESNHEDFFDDFVDEEADSFTLRLYETLRSDLPKYEVERG